MIFVTVCEHDSAYVLAVLREVRNVGNDNVDAEQLGLGEHQSSIDDDDVVGPANGHAIHAEFAESTQRDYL